MEYGVDNNYELDARFPWRCEFVYLDKTTLDGASFRADAIFIRNELRVKFLNDMSHPDYPNYMLVFCSVPKRDRSRFLESMRDLERAIILEGDRNYRQACRDIIIGMIREVAEAA